MGVLAAELTAFPTLNIGSVLVALLQYAIASWWRPTDAPSRKVSFALPIEAPPRVPAATSRLSRLWSGVPSLLSFGCGVTRDHSRSPTQQPPSLLL
jgi:hypothetical protein